MLAVAYNGVEFLVLYALLALPLVFFLRGKRKAGLVAVFTSTIPTILFLIVVAIPDGVAAREKAQRVACIQNQEIIAKAIEEMAKANGTKVGDRISTDELQGRLPGGSLPVCPAGGSYTVSKVGEMPVCSLAEHKSDGK